MNVNLDYGQVLVIALTIVVPMTAIIIAIYTLARK